MTVVTAFLLDVIATFITQLSYLFFKAAHLEREHTGSKRSIFCNCTWMIGFLCMGLGSAAHLIFLPFCPLVLLAMNSATAIVMSAGLAMCFLGERLVWRYDLAAFTFILVGCTGIVLLTKENEEQLTTEIVIDQMTSIKTVFFGLFYVFFLVFNYVFTRWFNG